MDITKQISTEFSILTECKVTYFLILILVPFTFIYDRDPSSNV